MWPLNQHTNSGQLGMKQMELLLQQQHDLQAGMTDQTDDNTLMDHGLSTCKFDRVACCCCHDLHHGHCHDLCVTSHP
jgi:hypothetical protein